MGRRLRDITAEMQQLGDGDPEASHARADELLIEAIKRLAPYATETVDEADDDALIAAYHGVKKWYA